MVPRTLSFNGNAFLTIHIPGTQSLYIWLFLRLSALNCKLAFSNTSDFFQIYTFPPFETIEMSSIYTNPYLQVISPFFFKISWALL